MKLNGWLYVVALFVIGAIFILALSNDSEDESADGGADNTSTSVGVTASTDPGTTTTPEVRLGGINATAIEDQFGPAVAMVMTRDCKGGLGTGSAFAIAPRTLVTNWHVVADDQHDANSTIDPRPWILTYKRGWRRGTVTGASSSPDVAVIELDQTEPPFDPILKWSDDDAEDDDYLALLGYPGLKGLEFQLSVGTAIESADMYENIPSFRVNRALSARTGRGNSGGPVLDNTGEVVGLVTWASFNWMTWAAQDASIVRKQVDSMLSSPTRPNAACDADSPSRYPLTYVVKLGTFPNMDEYVRRLAVLEEVSIPGAEIILANTADYRGWDGFLLSGYPAVMLAGPFESKEKAENAKGLYQDALDKTDQKDKFSTGLVPLESFNDSDVEQEREPCAELSGSWVSVTGVGPSDTLKLRRAPSTDAEIVDELDNDEILGLVVEPPVTAEGIDWVRVAPAKDDYTVCGWVARRYTTRN